MSKNKLTIIGLDDLRRELARLPAELVEEGSAIVMDAANDARDEIADRYGSHTRTGNLAHGLEVRVRDKSGYGVGVVLRNRSKHSHLFEFGTEARHTAIGADRGSMPAGKIFVPAVRRHRATMYGRLRALLERKGLRVTGQP